MIVVRTAVERLAEGAVVERPLPVIDESNRHYWEGAHEHRLVLLRCPRCDGWVHPPRPTCPRCRSERLDPAEASGRGKVYSWSVMRSPGNPGFDDRLPYAVLVVELAEQPGLLTIGNIVDCPLDAIEISMAVEVVWERIDDEVTLPQWRPATVPAARVLA
jgi:uncharacterized OB-fold protein